MMVVANTGVPMLMVYAPVFVLAFIPIVLIESFAIAKIVSRPVRTVLGVVTSANLVSTLVGVPLTWFVLVLIEVAVGNTRLDVGRIGGFVVQAPWLYPDERHLHWMIPAAGLTLTAPFFVVSAWSESLVIRAVWTHPDSQSRIRRSVWIANTISYALLATWWGVLLARAIAS